MKLKLYKHIYHKDIFLARNWYYCGGSIDTEFYFATRDIVKAIDDANKPNFEQWMESFNGSDRPLKAKITERMKVEIDGYEGVLEKELVFPVTEFAIVHLVEEYHDKDDSTG